MPVTGYVGLPGTGKTLQLVADCLEAHKAGRDVSANFLLGGRYYGAQLRCCEVFALGWSSYGHVCDLVLEPVSPALERGLRERAGAPVKFGRGFVPAAWSFFIDSWETLTTLRVKRDVFGRPHRNACDLELCEKPAGCSKGMTVALDELNLWAPSRLWAELGIGVLTQWAYVRKDGLDVKWSAQHEARIDKVAREVTDFIYTCRKLWPQIGPLRAFFVRSKFEARVLEHSTADRGSITSEGKTRALRFEWNFMSPKVAASYDTFERVRASKHLAGASGVRAEGRRRGGELVPMPRRPAAPLRTSEGRATSRGVTPQSPSAAQGDRQGRS